MSSLSKAWRGEERLWKVFWIYGVIGTIVLLVLLSIVNSIFGSTIAIVYALIIVAYTLWLTVAEWRCAFQTDWKIWGYVVRILIVLNLIGLVSGIIFGVIFGSSDMMKKAECRKKAREYVEQGGTEKEKFMAECLGYEERNDVEYNPREPFPEGQNNSIPQTPPSPAPSLDKSTTQLPEAPANTAPSPTPAPASPPVAAPVEATTAGNLDKYISQCEQVMAEHARNNNADPKTYIEQNQGYLRQCAQYHLEQENK